MELPMGLSPRHEESISNHPRRHPDLSSGLELQSSQLTAGRDLNITNITINARHRKQSLPDTRQLAQWLSSVNQHQVHKDIFDKVTPGTGEWIFDNVQFMGWLARKIHILWGTGIPGAGKTCLSSIIINHLLFYEQAAVVFFYCQYKEQPPINEIIACMLKQIVENSEDAAQYVALTLHASCARTNTKPSRSELLKTLNETAPKIDNLFFVVDALDELSDDTRSDLIIELAALQLPLLMTSRPIPNPLYVQPTEFTIRPPDEDFYKFISAKILRVSRLKPFLRDQSIRAELVRSVQEKCDGMFLLAALQIEALASAGITNARGLREAVERLPDTLNDQYKVTLQRIQCQSFGERTLAMHAILWVTHATRQLEVDELLEALTVDVEAASVDQDQRTAEETLVSVCLGLLTVEKESQTVRLIHFTTQEFFEGSKECLLKSPHAFIANICAIYLSWVQVDCLDLTSHRELLEHKTKNPFIEYSCCNLGHHTHHSMTESNGEIPMHVPKLFNKQKRAPIPLRPLEDRIDFGDAIHFAAAYGLGSLFEENIGAMDQQSLLGCTPLFYACLGGHLMLVGRMIPECAAILSMKTGSGATLIHAAVQSGNASIVGMLLSMCGLKATLSDSVQCIPNMAPINEEICIDINTQMLDGRTALYIASKEGYLPMVEALLSCLTTEPNVRENFGWTPLHLVALNDNASIARLLLDMPNIDINVKESDGWTPLHLAAQNDNESIARLLIDMPNIDINAKEYCGWTPLHLAAQNDNQSTAQLLLDMPNININAQTSNGGTPLHLAVLNDNESFVRLLLDMPNIDINTKQRRGWTPLHHAVQKGKVSITRLLLDMPHIDINAKEYRGWTPLHLVAQSGNEPIARLLLDMPNIDINAKDSDKWTPLYLAVLNGNESIARLLLDMPNIDINAKQRRGWTPLHLAAVNNNETIARLLLGVPNIDINAREYRGWTPLHLAAQNDNEPIARLLLDMPNIDINTKQRRGWTPLHLAALNDNESTARLLLDMPNTDINAKDSDGWTPLHRAAQNDNISIAGLLLSTLRIEVNALDEDGVAPLHVAAEKGHTSFVQLLTQSTLALSQVGLCARGTDGFTSLHSVTCNTRLDEGCISVDNRTYHGITPLAYAASFGHTSIVQLLLDSALVNVNNIDNDGDTPLMCAAYDGHASVARVLLSQPNILVNVRDKDHRRTALSKACDAATLPFVERTKNEAEAYSFVVLLLEHKDIDINLADDEGKTPFYYASTSGFHKVVELLQERGAII